MARYIDLDAVAFHGGPECAQWVSAAELAEYVERPAKWMPVTRTDFCRLWECPCCHKWQDYGLCQFCPHCGHEMETTEE